MNVFGLGQAQPEARAGLVGHFLAEEGAERLAGHAADQFAHRPAEIDHVVAIACARFPEGFLIFQSLDHVVPVLEPAWPDRVAQGRQRAFMVQHHANRGLLFAVLGKLRPVVGDQRLGIQLTPVDQDMGAQRGGGLGTGKDDGDRILTPGITSFRVRHAAPEVHLRFAIH